MLFFFQPHVQATDGLAKDLRGMAGIANGGVVSPFFHQLNLKLQLLDQCLLVCGHRRTPWRQRGGCRSIRDASLAAGLRRWSGATCAGKLRGAPAEKLLATV